MHVPEGSAGGAAPYYEDPMMKISRLESELEAARAEIERLRARLAESEKDRSKHDTPKAQSRYWTSNEHKRFLEALQKFGTKDVRSIATYVGSRNATQVRTHAQKYFLRIAREAKAGSALQAARKRSMSESDLARVGSSVRTPPGSPSSRDRDRDDNDPGSNSGVNNNNTSSSGIGIGIPPRQPSPSASSELTQQYQHHQQQKQRISSVINRPDELSSSSAIPSTTLVHSGQIREPELNVAKRSGSTATGLLGVTGSASNMRGNGGDSSIPKKEDVTMSDSRMAAVDDSDRDGGNGSGEMRKSTSFERTTESDIKSKLLTTDSTKGFQSSSGRPRGALSGRVASTGTLSSLATAPPVFHLNHPGGPHHFQTTSKHQSTFVTSVTNNESSSRMDFEGATWSQCVGHSKGMGTGLQAQELSSPDNQSSCNSTPRSQTNMTGMNHNGNYGNSCDKYEGLGVRDQQQQQQDNRQEESTTATQQGQAHEEQALQTHKSHQSPSQVMKREALPKMMPPLPPPSSIRSASQISGSKPPVGGGPNADTAGMNLLSLVATSEEKMDADTV